MHCSILRMSRVLFTGRAKNSFSVRPSYEYWGPWIGRNTRKSEMALNTEFEKASSAKSSTEAEVSMVSEDRLVDELMKQKVELLCMHVCLFDLHCAVTSYFISCLYFKRFQLCVNCARPVIWMQRDRGWIWFLDLGKRWRHDTHTTRYSRKSGEHLVRVTFNCTITTYD